MKRCVPLLCGVVAGLASALPAIATHDHLTIDNGPVEGACAQILLVDGNSLQDVSILGDDAKKPPLIMADGKIYKNNHS